MNHVIEAARQQMPAELQEKQARLAEVEQEMGNLMQFIRKGVQSDMLAEEFTKCEAQVKLLRAEVETARQTMAQTIALPDEAWVRGKLKDLASLLKTQMPKAALVLRGMLCRIVAQPMIAPGKKRGYVRLHFRIDGLGVIAAAMGDKLSTTARQMMAQTPDTSGAPISEAFVVDVGAPTNMDLHGPTVVAMRNAGTTWKAIAEVTGLKIQNAYILYKRLTGAQPPSDPPAEKPPAL